MTHIICQPATNAVILWLAFGLLSMSHGMEARDEPGPLDIVPGDDIWLISARGFDGCQPFSTDQLDYLQYANGDWQEPVGKEGFCQSVSQVQMPTVVFVHGYQTDLQDAQLRGLQVYRNIFRNNCRSGPIRFVIWAWKSEKELCRPIPDFTMKSHRADQLGDTFALSINQVGNQPLIVVSYSLGTQVVVSALTRSSLYQGRPVQFAAIAAATDCGLGSCSEQLWSSGNIRRSLIFTNRGDRAIRVAKITCRLTEGRKYRSFEEMAPLHDKQLGQVNLIDLSAVASRKHSVTRYTSIPVVQSCIQQLVEESATASCSGFYGFATVPSFVTGPSMATAVRNIGRNVCELR